MSLVLFDVLYVGGKSVMREPEEVLEVGEKAPR
jgi:hypothetical protein